MLLTGAQDTPVSAMHGFPTLLKMTTDKFMKLWMALLKA